MRVMMRSFGEMFRILLEKNINVKSSYKMIDEFRTCLPEGDSR